MSHPQPGQRHEIMPCDEAGEHVWKADGRCLLCPAELPPQYLPAQRWPVEDWPVYPQPQRRWWRSGTPWLVVLAIVVMIAFAGYGILLSDQRLW